MGRDDVQPFYQNNDQAIQDRWRVHSHLPSVPKEQPKPDETLCKVAV